MGLLIVDDSFDIRLLLQVLLRAEGYETLHIAESAQQAFRLLGVEGDAEPEISIDLILMDINMAEIDGIEACRRIKVTERIEIFPSSWSQPTRRSSISIVPSRSGRWITLPNC